MTVIHRYRYLARIVIQAATPIAVGTNHYLLDSDAPVEKDCNGLPYIPATAITGFLRHRPTQNKLLNELFGKAELDTYQNNKTSSEEPSYTSKGSNIIISNALLVDNKNKVHQKPTLGLQKDEFLAHYFRLPIRQHVKINHLGVAETGALFNREIVYKGSRFKFEIGMDLTEKNDALWEELLHALGGNDFYIGAGQYNNFGALDCLCIKSYCYDIKNELDKYLKVTVDLNNDPEELTCFNPNKTKVFEEETIQLSGNNSFFHFGSGYGDHEVDHANYQEEVLEWHRVNENTGKNYNFTKKFIIPGTSIKGALAHRMAYYCNESKGNTVEKALKTLQKEMADYIENFSPANTLKELDKQENILKNFQKGLLANGESIFIPYIGSKNKVVNNVFGSAKNTDEDTEGHAGKLIVNDIYLSENTKEVIFTHNKIDRFTGGTVDSALYSEKVLQLDEPVTLILKMRTGISDKKPYKAAIRDLKSGQLALGGLVNKGHGVFKETK